MNKRNEIVDSLTKNGIKVERLLSSVMKSANEDQD